ncbi:MAG: hypothetical protein AMJ76_03265 [Dehalococcoidia bacterium SM23_28_1]|nr:MAG: hypothetical protein AMJ76_03265 [Dehalococcoidia bacterium SM23_28_1]
MATVHLKVTPSASRDALIGWQEDVLRLRVTAPAQRGKANEAVLRLLAAALGIERRRLRIVRGHTTRHKVVSVDGLDEEEIRARLGSASS